MSVAVPLFVDLMITFDPISCSPVKASITTPLICPKLIKCIEIKEYMCWSNYSRFQKKYNKLRSQYVTDIQKTQNAYSDNLEKLFTKKQYNCFDNNG